MDDHVSRTAYSYLWNNRAEQPTFRSWDLYSLNENTFGEHEFLSAYVIDREAVSQATRNKEQDTEGSALDVAIPSTLNTPPRLLNSLVTP